LIPPIEGQKTPLPHQRRRTVFVVDDDPSMLKGVGRLLKQHGFEFLPFETARALKKHDNFDNAFCIVLDINLSDGSGIELQHQLVEAGVSLPIIYMTGNDSDATRTTAMASGCLAYLTKPFPAQALIEPIQRAAAMFA
jgi:FixJ family two-component response regulator